MYRLIWVFAGHTGHIVGFVMRWLISYSFLPAAVNTADPYSITAKVGEKKNEWLCSSQRNANMSPTPSHTCYTPLTFITLWLIQQTTNWWYFSWLSQKTGFDISCKLSPMETICLKCQILFSVENKKKYVNMSTENFNHTAKPLQQFDPPHPCQL